MVKNTVYLKYGYAPTHHTSVYCDHCNAIVNAGPNYKPRYCAMCGTKIEDNLDTVEWKDEDASWLEYVEYELEEHPDYLIVKVRYERTDDGIIGFPKSVRSCPVVIGEDMDKIIHFANLHCSGRYVEDDFEPATKNELIEYARTCGQYWRC